MIFSSRRCVEKTTQVSKQKMTKNEELTFCNSGSSKGSSCSNTWFAIHRSPPAFPLTMKEMVCGCTGFGIPIPSRMYSARMPCQNMTMKERCALSSWAFERFPAVWACHRQWHLLLEVFAPKCHGGFRTSCS